MAQRKPGRRREGFQKAVELTEEQKLKRNEAAKASIEAWKPRTDLGRRVKSGEITSIDQILDSGQRIMEQEIVDALLGELSNDLLLIGQSKGKFGGGQRRAFKQTQKKTAEGNKPSFGTMVVIGNRNGYVGLGYGKSRETVLSREKALRNAKLNIIKIRRGCGSWQCGCRTPHTIPFKIRGKCGSVTIELMPAPKGSGLRVAEECRKVLALAGVSDVWSTTFGQTRTTINLASACFAALKALGGKKIRQENIESMGIIEGAKV
ncbi:30S ribosomal protein S5 [Candidatus Woesearchaeota archaeon]|nr:30S ribosomal protein S5 [Candidatus Woesearchaeota archaeon]